MNNEQGKRAEEIFGVRITQGYILGQEILVISGLFLTIMLKLTMIMNLFFSLFKLNHLDEDMIRTKISKFQ